jgi:putative MATE family efflux protein
VQGSVTIAEIYFIGRLGTVSLAAMALVFPLMMLVQMLASGTIGGSVTGVIARTLGAGQEEKAEALLWHVLYLSLAFGVALFIVYLLFGEAILRLLGGEAIVLEQALVYVGIFFPGSVVVWLAHMMMGVVRGTGNMKLPAAMMIIAACIQIPLSGILILGIGPLPSLGISGAAISILTVNLVNASLLIFLHGTGQLRIQLKVSQIRPRLEYFNLILSVAAIAAIAPFFTVFTILFMTGLVGRYGTEALAGYGIAARIEFLITPLAFGLGIAMNTMVGSCVGAGLFQRAERVGWIGGLCTGALTGLAGILLALFPEFWIQIFSDDPATLAMASSYFQITGPFFGFFGMGLSLFFASQGAGAVGWPVVATACRFGVVVGGGWLIANLPDSHPGQLFMCIAAGMFIFFLGTSSALYLGTWRKSENV